MRNIRPFEIGVLALFAFMFIAAIVVVKFIDPENDDPIAQLLGSRVVIWGTLPYDVFSPVLIELSKEKDEFAALEYHEIDERDFDDKLVNAIAEGRGPDVVIMPHTKLMKHASKLILTPYEPNQYGLSAFSPRDFMSTFVDGAELYMMPEGIAGIPLALDPLVMYWNRDILSTNGFALPPATWEEVVNQLVPDIVQRDFNRNILLSPIALGEYRNINNAFAILSALMLQGGSRMVYRSGNSFVIDLDSSTYDVADNPATNAVEFYTSFATVNNPLYSWNRAKPNDLNAFAAGDVAVYFGMGSEYKDILRLNPNLNFDIAEIPQPSTGEAKRTYGDFYAFSMLRTASNISGAEVAINELALSNYYSNSLVTRLGMASVQRSMLAEWVTDPVRRVFNTSALYARGWLNPDRTASEAAFSAMVDSVLANRNSVRAAVADAMVRLRQAF